MSFGFPKPGSCCRTAPAGFPTWLKSADSGIFIIFPGYSRNTLALRPALIPENTACPAKKCRLPEICPYRGNRYYPALIHYTHFPAFRFGSPSNSLTSLLVMQYLLAILFRSLPCLCSSLISAAFHLCLTGGFINFSNVFAPLRLSPLWHDINLCLNNIFQQIYIISSHFYPPVIFPELSGYF